MMKGSKFLMVCAIFCVFLTAKGQNTDLARLEYTYFPQSSSDNSFRRFRTSIAFPIELKEGTYLMPGLEYRNVNFEYEDPAAFQTYDLDRFQSFTFSLGYTFQMNEFWRFGAEGGVKIASNFTLDKAINDDFIYTGALIFVKIKEDERYYKPTRLILGLRYSTTTGFPFPLPIINYYRRWNKNWSYMAGSPKSNLKYYFNEKNAVEAFVTLDGFFANIQEDFNVAPLRPGSDKIARSISMTVLLSGVGYEHSFTDHLKFYLYAGNTILNDIRFRDNKKNSIYTINDKNSIYARSGLKFSIF
nr:DUF6268 family outer membrane beta-barrel protein [Christiangramia fulva]